MAVVTPTNRPTAVRNCCVIKVFCWCFCVVTLLFWIFCWCRYFYNRTESDHFPFLLLHNAYRQTCDGKLERQLPSFEVVWSASLWTQPPYFQRQPMQKLECTTKHTQKVNCVKEPGLHKYILTNPRNNFVQINYTILNWIVSSCLKFICLFWGFFLCVQMYL